MYTVEALHAQYAKHTRDLFMVKVPITPALARALLERNVVNRPLRRTAVARYAVDMARGTWDSDNPQGIVLNRALELVNGQHRLTALATVGQTIPMIVAFNSDATYRTPMDRGEVRTISDLTLQSQRSVASATVLLTLFSGADAIVTPSRVAEVLHEFGSDIQWAGKALPSRRMKSAGVLAAFAFVHSIDKAVAESFATKLTHLEGGVKSPVRVLFEFMARGAPDTAKGRHHAALVTLRCLQAFARKEGIDRVTRPTAGYTFWLSRRQKAVGS